MDHRTVIGQPLPTSASLRGVHCSLRKISHVAFHYPRLIPSQARLVTRYAFVTACYNHVLTRTSKCCLPALTRCSPALIRTPCRQVRAQWRQMVLPRSVTVGSSVPQKPQRAVPHVLCTMITLSAFAARGPNERHHFPPTSPRPSNLRHSSSGNGSANGVSSAKKDD